MTVKEYLVKHGRSHTSYLGLTQLFPILECVDGTTMSVQASSMHHCYPEETLKGDEINNYETLEVYTDLSDDRLLAYEVYEYTYGGVPVELLDEIISEHGGICREE